MTSAEFVEFLRGHDESRGVGEGVSAGTVVASFPVGLVADDVFSEAHAAGMRPYEVNARDGGVFVAFMEVDE